MTSSIEMTTTVLSATLSTILPGYEEYAREQKSQTGWTSPDSWVTKLFRGDPGTILFAAVVTLSLPVLLHIYFYTQASRTSKSADDGVPTFVLLGPSNAGKTSLVTSLQERMISATEASKSVQEAEVTETKAQTNGTSTHIKTRASQVSHTIGLHLPPGTPLGSNRYRSENDPEVLRANREPSPYKLIDTPGHPKLRSAHSLPHLSPTGKPTQLQGVIFMLDSTSLEAPDSASAKDTTSYLHDVLLTLQKRRRNVTKKQANDFPVLIAANKQDLFTALPPLAIKQRLEQELQRLRMSKRKAISAVDHTPEVDEDEDETVLGGGGEAAFTFKALEDEFGVAVDVLGGTVAVDEGRRGVGKWEAWIGSCL